MSQLLDYEATDLCTEYYRVRRSLLANRLLLCKEYYVSYSVKLTPNHVELCRRSLLVVTSRVDATTSIAKHLYLNNITICCKQQFGK